MGLPKEEWLPQAQRLAVGRSDRVYHRFESRPNLLISNHGDRWSAHCFSCGEGGVVFKEHVRLDSDPDQDKAGLQWPVDAVPLEQADEYHRRAAYALVAQKGLDYSTMLADLPLHFSKATQRLLFPSAQGWLGRAMNPRQPTKWVLYQSQGHYQSYAFHPADRFDRRPVVLTEDLLSAYKLRWATDASVLAVALLGTKIKPALLANLLDKEVAILLDGDEAGRLGAEKAHRQLRGLGLHSRLITCPDGKDPKDLSRQQIQELLCA